MPTLSDIIRGSTRLGGVDADWLHHLVGDWQFIADLSFADLVLWVRADVDGDGGPWTVATHVRPNTGPLVFHDDLVGRRADRAQADLLDRCVEAGDLVADDAAARTDAVTVFVEAVPVVREGKLVAALTRHTNRATMRPTSRLELTYRSLGDALVGMIPRGEFPTLDTPTGTRHGAPRVGDGVVRLDAEGIVMYASPNATSALHRLGHTEELVGDYLARVATSRLEDHAVVDETLAVVVTGRAPWQTEIESGGACLTLRAVPLTRHGTREGALVLVRDVSELRRRERELLSKDATIREIHHRVKNNLQTVAALLRLQSRRVDDGSARAALTEAGRRVATIAVVHDTLSRTLDEDVDFDEVISRALNAVVEVATERGRVRWRLEGSFGRVGAEDATTIAMIVTELVQNAAEHGFGAEGGTVVVEVARDGEEPHLEVSVADDGVGLPDGFRPHGGGLGTQIVQSFVQDLRGSITWERLEPHGTRVSFDARLRRPRGGS